MPGIGLGSERGTPGVLFLTAVLLVAVLSGCAPEKKPFPVRTGAEVLAGNDFESLSGQRVGVIANHTAQVDTAHLVDRLAAAPDVELGAIFAPEHGFRGTAGAGESIEGGQDLRTGTPVYSLYDDTRRPTPEELQSLDALVFDVQDVGARFYTYITTMGLAMQAAAEADLQFVVLDRPNPLGGTYTSGFVLEPAHSSFVGRYPIPIAHGMTIGELARYIQEQRLLPGVAVDTTTFTPQSMPQAAPSPRFEGEQVHGFELEVTDRQAVYPLEIGIHALHAMYRQAQAEGYTNFVSRPQHLTRLAGTNRLLRLLRNGTPPDSIVASWREEVAAFRNQRSAALLY